MKKIVLTFVAISAYLNATSEESLEVFKPIKGTFTTQVGLNIGSGSNIRSFGLNGRYFLNKNLALRLTYTGNSNNSLRKVNQFPDGTGLEGTYRQKMNSNFVLFGLEKHFSGTKRFSPFVGVELGIGRTVNKDNGENCDGYQYIGSYGREYINKQNNYRVNTFIGFDYYITNTIYIGAEYQFLRYDLTNYVQNDQTVTQNNITTTTKRGDYSINNFSSNSQVSSLRLGWKIN
jgi:outer membrane protein W